jgi:hypothetical protein
MPPSFLRCRAWLGRCRYKQLASPPKLSAAAAVKVFGFQVSAAIEIGFDMFSVEVNGSLFGGWIVARVRLVP